jgi:hypothetical protein
MQWNKSIMAIAVKEEDVLRLGLANHHEESLGNVFTDGLYILLVYVNKEINIFFDKSTYSLSTTS